MESFLEVLNLVKKDCHETMSDVAFNCWIRDIEPVKLDNNNAIIFVKSSFQKNILLEQYFEKIKKSFNNILGFDVNIIIATENDVEQYISSSYPPLPESDLQPDYDTLIKENQDKAPELFESYEGAKYEYTFDTFIVGSSNNFAYAACKAICQNRSGAYNPLFIYSESGLGKTHLLSAISNEISANNPNLCVISVNSEKFTNDLISSLKTQTISSFREKYRKADVLLIDDIQFIAGKESTQEEFFHTFNELHQVGKQIVLTSDRPPKDIKTLEDRLKSRFEGGLLTDISPPDFETRIAIIRRKAELLQIEIPADVTEYIANKLKTNIRQLEGAVKKIKAYKLLAGSPPSIGVAQTVIREILNDNQPVPVTVERIIEEVSKTYSISTEDIRSNKRTAPVSAARQAAMYIVREITQMSLAAIGEEFGGRDHSSIVYSLNQAEKMMKVDLHNKSVIDDIIKNIRNR